MNVRPITIGPRNAEQMTGHSWRWLRDHADELGVEIVTLPGSAKRVILADDLLRALAARSAQAQQVEPSNDVDDEIARMRAAIARAG